MVEMLLSREVLELQLLKQVRSVLGCTEKPRTESGLFPVCPFWMIWMIRTLICKTGKFGNDTVLERSRSGKCKEMSNEISPFDSKVEEGKMKS